MTSRRAVVVYRKLLWLYPRSFRDEYGSDMALLFADQLRDEPAARVWARGAVDLAITVPARHLEAHVNRPPNAVVPLLFASLSLAGALAGLVGGSNLSVLAVGMAIAVLAGALAIAARRQTRAVTPQSGVTAQWWKLLTFGSAALVAMIVAEGATDLSLWWPMVITVLCALVALAAGLVLGLAHLTRAVLHRPS